MGTLLLGFLIVLNLVLLVLAVFVFQRVSNSASQAEALTRLASQAESLHQTLSRQFASATADMATRLEQTKGDLRQQVSDRLGDGFSGIR
ncbi:MAG: hypothetical protein QOJ41_1645, partial [Acidobacteriaceae bacterium]|nr:hypothetical protein [Acidobacteriaceae bacterium]